MDNERRTAVLFLCAGLLLFLPAYSSTFLAGGMPRGQFFVLALWGYVFLVDNVGYWLSGSSLLVSRTKEALPLALGSLGIVCVFELLNLRLASWSYVSVPFGLPARWGTLVLGWAALLPLIFVTAELLPALGFTGKPASKRFAVSPWLLNLFCAVGFAMLGLALAFPAALGPLVFAAFLFLAEPVNFWTGLPSLLREFSWGLPGKAIRLAVAGILSALAWSGIAGLLGAHPAGGGFIKAEGVLGSPVVAYAVFAFFALEAYSLYSLCSALRGGRTWEKGVWAMRGHAPAPYFKWVALAAEAAAVYAVLSIIDGHTALARLF